jgi:hypothetical protein
MAGFLRMLTGGPHQRPINVAHRSSRRVIIHEGPSTNPWSLEPEIPKAYQQQLSSMESELEEQEKLLSTFDEKWDAAAHHAYELAKYEVEKTHQEIDTLIVQSMSHILKSIAETNIEMLQEDLLNYEKAVKRQLFSFLRRGRRKKLKLIKPFMERLKETEQALKSAVTLEDFDLIITTLSSSINQLTDEADRQALNIGRFQYLTDEMMHHRHPLLLLKTKYTPTTIKRSLAQELAPIDQALDTDCLETKEALTTRALSRAKKSLQDAQHTVQAALTETDFHTFSEKVNLTQSGITGFLNAVSHMKEVLKDHIKNLHSHLPQKALQKKSLTASSQSENLKNNLAPAIENYERCIENLILTYQTQVRSQWFWRFRMGRRKIALLKKYSEKSVSIPEIESNPLNQGKFKILLEKIKKLSERSDALFQEVEKLKHQATNSSSTLSREMEYAIEQLNAPLAWLDSIEEDALKSSARLAPCRTSFSEDTPAPESVPHPREHPTTSFPFGQLSQMRQMGPERPFCAPLSTAEERTTSEPVAAF